MKKIAPGQTAGCPLFSTFRGSPLSWLCPWCVLRKLPNTGRLAPSPAPVTSFTVAEGREMPVFFTSSFFKKLS